jgi:hypothetical protein
LTQPPFDEYNNFGLFSYWFLSVYCSNLDR